tara:strand:- start:793 stop:948 length:156 start_codon:yes stop_codon:yes gene_type:complete
MPGYNKKMEKYEINPTPNVYTIEDRYKDYDYNLLLNMVIIVLLTYIAFKVS